ncbi:hypothetical protein OEZ85_006589 [Tetradesmus obliquus]|uniref:TOG domain-containing protein n=1 Tax=Tetradesmus obliquus TaxID=3088 RepID=A0ABY8TXI7_TETOB|nr:hypothetical protein OEZ85_006589 [Tetradesmus obliquus]
MATRTTLGANKPGTNPALAEKDHRTKILLCLTKLNEKSTLRAAAEELSVIIRALDNDSLQALVQSICSTGAWEPKAFAKKECIKVLAQLPQPSCPVADVVVQQYLGKILAHLKKQLQDTDSLVRDAACEALAAYAWALADAAGSSLPGNSSCPVVKLIFECLAEQKKEAQHGASQALLMVAPCIGPLDKELVKLILRMLKSATFQGTAPLLAAIASTDADTHAPVGLLKAGAGAFLPYLNHLVGQPSSRRSSSGYDAASSQAASSGSGIIGCLAAKDWAVRRAAADALRAAVLLLGPAMEPDGRWQLGDPSSLTHRCLSALDAQSCKFDKVREARDAAREAAGLLQELQRFVQDEGPDGDWRAWVSSHVANTGCVTPTSSSAQHSPLRSNTSDLETRMSEDWGTPGSNSISAGGVSGSMGGTGMRCKPGLSVLDTLSAGHRSCSGTNTPTSAGGNRGWESQMATPSDLDTAYADALRGDKGDVHLLRLIQKTGPVWSKLAPHTSKGLLAVFIKHVKDGVMLHRVLPWLWRLADEDEGRPDLPEELQQQLLEALHCCPVAEDPQTSEKVALLESSLRTVWQHSKQQ